MEWDPKIPGQTVAYRDNPGKIGKTTGKTMGEGELLKVQVDFGPNSVVFKRYDVLKLVDTQKGIEDKFLDRDFGTPEDLRRILIFEKMKGRLTNVFYSMEIGNTDFYPHQFKPVLKFIESVQGRMLIADEVGLGKTVEAVYIWKELQAREDARRMLVVCPAMLRYKWQSDLYNLFNIEAEIKNASEITGELERLYTKRDKNKSFVYIISLEAVRPPAWYEDFPDSKKPRVRLANILDASSQDPDFDILDLTIVDEAHYMRNPETANFRLGRLLREASKSMLLLTATPIQTNSKNLFSLLRLIDPDTFSYEYVFELLMNYNKPLTRTMNALCNTPVDINEVLQCLQELVENHGFEEDKSIIEMSLRLHDSREKVSMHELSEFTKIIESRSLLANFMSRTRKRDVIENSVTRSPEVLKVDYTEYEETIYRELSKRVFETAELTTSIAHFVLITRQRQMASSLPAALKAWQDNTYLEDLESFLWEDLGEINEEDDSDKDLICMDFPVEYGFLEIDIEKLYKEDSKYHSLKKSLQKMLEINPREKCVIFAYFRPTLKYLQKRLNEDGITAELIIGGMMPSEKQAVLETFADSMGFQILLSSEVGSEGIDLQFCRYLVNYDLPWNPMRVEQRIGRLDRLGQKANRITILNLASFDTIEERILLRLYDRINLFKESIGDLEEILGSVTREILDYAFNPELTEAEKDKKSREAIRILENQRQQQKEIEDNAINLVGFTDYIYNSIQGIRDKHRWIRSEDLITFVYDFFAVSYPETVLRKLDSNEYDFIISLSSEAKLSLDKYIRIEKPQTRTKLHRVDSVHCTFDQKTRHLKGRERVDILHPIIQWIRSEYTQDHKLMHGVSAIGISASQIGLDRGLYVYLVQRWTFRGIKENEQLVFLTAKVGAKEPIDNDCSETIVQIASADGIRITNARNVIPYENHIAETYFICMERMNSDYDAVLYEKQVENYRLCDNQVTSAEQFMNRRLKTLKELLERYKKNPDDINRNRMIKPTEGKIKKENNLFELKRSRIMEKREIDDELQEVAAGLIVVI